MELQCHCLLGACLLLRKLPTCMFTLQAAFRSNMDKDDILSLDLSALDPHTAADIDRSQSAPTFLESR